MIHSNMGQTTALTSATVMWPNEHKELCGMIAYFISTLQWRHNGLGLLQAYIREGERSELRVHIWHPELQRPGIIDSGLYHDHRFDLTSKILVGSIKQREFRLTPAVLGSHVLHEVVHARAAAGSKHAPNDGLVTTLPGRYHVEQTDMWLGAGSAYTFPKREFHGSLSSELTVTLMLKTNQDSIPARILAPYDTPVVHAFADPLPHSKWKHITEGAKEALMRMWETR